MEVLGAKVLAGFLFFFLALFFGWVPFCVARRFIKPNKDKSVKQKRIPFVEYLHSMAAGVLIATCLLHLLPESLDAVKEAMESRIDSPLTETVFYSNGSTTTDEETEKTVVKGEGDQGYYPIAELLVAIGFLFVYFIDSTIKALQVTSSNNRELTESNYNDEDTIFQQGVSSQVKSRRKTLSPSSKRSVSERVARSKRALSSGTSQVKTGISQDKELFEENNGFVDSDEGEHFHEVDSESELSLVRPDADGSEISFNPTLSDEIHPMADIGLQTKPKATKSAHLRSVALVAALCIHGFFDGVMLGLQTSIRVILSLLLALSVHKSFVALGLSFTLLNNHKKDTSVFKVLLYFFLFASAAPLGLGMSAAFIHTALDVSNDKDLSLLPGCLQAFAVGTFLYVTFSETTERHQKRNVLCECINHVFLVLGFVFMAWIRVEVGDS